MVQDSRFDYSRIHHLPMILIATRPAAAQFAQQRSIIKVALACSRAISSACSTISSDDSSSSSSFTADNITECNKRYEGILRIKNAQDKGHGLFASKAFDRDDLIMSARAISESEERTSHSIQKDWQTHVEMDLPAILINHSCDANVGIVDNDIGAYDFVALRKIEKDEELLWDYECAEYELSTPFQCACGSERCVGILRGFKYNGDVIKERYDPFYASYLKRQ